MIKNEIKNINFPRKIIAQTCNWTLQCAHSLWSSKENRKKVDDSQWEGEKCEAFFMPEERLGILTRRL